MSTDTEVFDPSAPEGETSGRQQYMTRKDLRVIAMGLVCFGLILTPVYSMMKARSEKYRCSLNMKAITDALSFYALEHDSRYPPVARTENLGSPIPSLGVDGKVYTWAGDIATYMNPRASFLCPTAKDDEIVKSEDPKESGKSLLTSYGMYAPYSGFLTSLVENPDQTVIVAETSNRGAEGSYDPLPFASSSGEPLPDGFIVGWNDSNLEPSSKTTSVTRLAFRDTQGGKFTKTGDSRHGVGIHLLTASGERILATPDAAAYVIRGRTNPFWLAPPAARRSQ